MTTLRCFCDRCDGRVTYTSAEGFYADHPHGSQFMVVEMDGRPYTSTPNCVAQLFDWAAEGNLP